MFSHNPRVWRVVLFDNRIEVSPLHANGAYLAPVRGHGSGIGLWSPMLATAKLSTVRNASSGGAEAKYARMALPTALFRFAWF